MAGGVINFGAALHDSFLAVVPSQFSRGCWRDAHEQGDDSNRQRYAKRHGAAQCFRDVNGCVYVPPRCFDEQEDDLQLDVAKP